MRHVWRSRTYQKFVFSFCLLLILLAIAFSSLLRGMALSSAENDLRSSSLASVKQSAFLVNQLLSNMDTISSTIGTTASINNYQIATMSAERVKLIKALRQYQSFNSIICDIFYIPVRGPYLMSGNSTYTLDTFSRIYRRENLSRDRLERMLQSNGAQPFALLDSVTDTVQKSAAREVVSAMYSLPNNAVANLKIAARTRDIYHTFQFYNLGIHMVQRESFNSALELGAKALHYLGFTRYQAYRASRTFKHHEEAVLAELYQHWQEDESRIIREARLFSEELDDIMQAEHRFSIHETDYAWDITSIRKEAKEDL